MQTIQTIWPSLAGALVCLCLFELWRLLRMLRREMRSGIEKAASVLDKAFQALDNANDVAEKLENAAEDIAETTESVKQKSKGSILNLFRSYL
jgi:hypothetical protein